MKFTSIFTVALIVSVSFSGYSQTQKTTLNKHRNHVSFAPFTLVFGKPQVSYERVICRNMSLGVTVGAKTSSGLLTISGLNTGAIKTDEFSFKGIEIMPEYRWYVQRDIKRSHTGFFTGAFFRYRNYVDRMTGEYFPRAESLSHDINIDLRMKSSTLGLEIGYKLPIKDHCFIDFVIAGPGVSLHQFSLKNKGMRFKEEFYSDLSDALVAKYGFLDKVIPDIVFKEKDPKVRTARLTLPSFYYAIKLGYAF